MRLHHLFLFFGLLPFIGSIILGILGCAEEPTAWPSNPEILGPFDVNRYDIDFQVPNYGRYTGFIYHPVLPQDTASPTLLPEAPFPALVLANGYSAPVILLSWLAEHLSSHGFIVLGFTPQNPFSLDVTSWASGFSCGLEVLEEENNNNETAVYKKVDLTSAGFIGLSMGGAGAIEAAGKGAAVNTIVALAPGINDLGGFIFHESLKAAELINIPVQIQVGSLDCIVNPPAGTMLGFTNLTGKGVLTYYDLIPSSKLYLEINGANHVAYIQGGIAEIGNFMIATLIPIDCEPTLPTRKQHRISAKYATMWFHTYLYETTAWENMLFGQGLQEDLQSGVLSNYMID